MIRVGVKIGNIRNYLKPKILRIKGVKIGKNNNIDWNCRFIKSSGEIIIGNRNEFVHGVLLMTYGGSIVIGNDCSINPYTIIYGHGKGTKIGNNVLIAGHCMLIPSTHNFSKLNIPINQQGESSSGIIIEDNVWLGTGCKILNGVTIGAGSIVAAGSVVTKSIEPNCVVGGVPAVLIKRRNDS